MFGNRMPKMNVLENLFGLGTRVKLIKLFLMNPDSVFDAQEVSERLSISPVVAKKEIHDLQKTGFIRDKSHLKEFKKQKDRTIVLSKKRVDGWILDKSFPYLEPLESFISNVNPFKNRETVDRILRTGKIHLLLISGVFIKYEDARVDLLVVGDDIKNHQIENVIKEIEAEIGREIKYVVFDTSEFKYRHSLFDKLVMDIIEFPHEKIINKLGI